jgi:[ribosomal protein S5]-alanine N-acetyltransferase
MTIQTPSLFIRELTESDITNIHDLHSLPQTDEFNTLGIPESISITEKIVAEWVAAQQQEPRTSYTFCIEHTNAKEFIGLIGLKMGKPNYLTAEVWYKLHPSHWGNGYATEALNKILHFAFTELKLHRIEAGCAIENIASIKVLEKVGMIREGRKRKKLPIRGEWKDNYFYAILEEDFLK